MGIANALVLASRPARPVGWPWGPGPSPGALGGPGGLSCSGRLAPSPGLPDLTLLSRSGELSFVEVKGPGDQLRPEQREWLTLLPRWGFPATCLALEAARDAD